MPLVREKSLPPLPLCARRAEVVEPSYEFLEEAIEALVKQNDQYAIALDEHKKGENELKENIDCVLEATEALTGFELSERFRRYKSQTVTINEWLDFCIETQPKLSDRAWNSLETVKKRILENEKHPMVMRENKLTGVKEAAAALNRFREERTARLNKFEAESQEEWRQFCSQTESKLGTDLWVYLKNVKKRMKSEQLEKDIEEIVEEICIFMK